MFPMAYPEITPLEGAEITNKSAPPALLSRWPGHCRGTPALDYLPMRLHSWKVVLPRPFAERSMGIWR